MKSIIATLAVIVALLGYSTIGTGTRVDEIKAEAKESIESRGWKILRYEGYQWGSWAQHGGRVWYHVADVKDPSIQYRIFITKRGGELHYWYKNPEPLSRININHKNQQ